MTYTWPRSKKQRQDWELRSKGAGRACAHPATPQLLTRCWELGYEGLKWGPGLGCWHCCPHCCSEPPPQGCLQQPNCSLGSRGASVTRLPALPPSPSPQRAALTGGTVLLASPRACATAAAAAAPSAATTASPAARLGTGRPGLGSAGPAGIGWGHSLGIGGRSTRVVAGSRTGLGAQGTWRCCWGRGPIVARGGAQGRSGRWGARGVGGRHSWGLGVLVAVDRLGAVFGWRLQEKRTELGQVLGQPVHYPPPSHCL